MQNKDAAAGNIKSVSLSTAQIFSLLAAHTSNQADALQAPKLAIQEYIHTQLNGMLSGSLAYMQILIASPIAYRITHNIYSPLVDKLSNAQIIEWHQLITQNKAIKARRFLTFVLENESFMLKAIIEQLIINCGAKFNEPDSLSMQIAIDIIAELWRQDTQDDDKHPSKRCARVNSLAKGNLISSHMTLMLEDWLIGTVSKCMKHHKVSFNPYTSQYNPRNKIRDAFQQFVQSLNMKTLNNLYCNTLQHPLHLTILMSSLIDKAEGQKMLQKTFFDIITKVIPRNLLNYSAAIRIFRKAYHLLLINAEMLLGTIKEDVMENEGVLEEVVMSRAVGQEIEEDEQFLKEIVMNSTVEQEIEEDEQFLKEIVMSSAIEQEIEEDKEFLEALEASLEMLEPPPTLRRM